MSSHHWRDRAAIVLPMRHRDHDPDDGITKNRGRLGGDFDFEFGAGAQIPTKLAHSKGYDFNLDALISKNKFTPSVEALSILFTFQIDSQAAISYLGDHRVNGGAVNWLFLITTTVIRFYCGTTDGASSAAFNWSGEVGRKTTVAGVWDGSDTHLYVNGIWRSKAVTPFAPAGVDEDVHIGESAASAQRFIGKIYEYTNVDGEALDPTQIAQYHRERLEEIHTI